MHSTGTGDTGVINHNIIMAISNVRVLYLWCLHGYITPNDNIFSSKVVKN